jgi:hypothetical protein
MLDLYHGTLLGVPEIFPKVIKTLNVIENYSLINQISG